MKAGLAPGQVRRGLGLLREVVECIKRFALMVGIKTIALEALYYHNAIAYERYGFSYFEGYKRMKRIDEGQLEQFDEIQRKIEEQLNQLTAQPAASN